MKVADFGLAVDLQNYFADEAVGMNGSSSPSILPLKWMAIEYLRDRRAFSTKSDVVSINSPKPLTYESAMLLIALFKWSFGVVFWELMTRAASPYSGVSNSEIRVYLESGRRLSQPSYCPDMMSVWIFPLIHSIHYLYWFIRYEIMVACWRMCPADRPDFAQLAYRIGEILQACSPGFEKQFDYFMV